MTYRLARYALTAFLFTFLASRLLVLCIMLRWIPDLYLHLGGTHVHHLNYGIFLLSAVGGVLLFRPPVRDKARCLAALTYGIGLALTFDEFAMWLHLGGGYWQRQSFDAVVIIAAGLGLLAAAPALARFRSLHWSVMILLALLSSVMMTLAVKVSHRAEAHYGPRIHQVEYNAPQ